MHSTIKTIYIVQSVRGKKITRGGRSVPGTILSLDQINFYTEI
jgi:hypothetical protein